MLSTSPEYKKAIREQFRLPIYATVRWEFVDESAKEDMNAVANGESPLSEVEKISSYKKKESYASCENKGFRLGYGQYVVPDDLEDKFYQGFESEILSNEDGIFTENPYIIMTFSKAHRSKGLNLFFDESLSRFPRQIRVQIYNNGDTILDSIKHPDSPVLRIEEDLEEFDGITLTWLSTNYPYQRARLSYIMFGMQLTFDNDLIDQARGIRHSEEIDPIMRRLPMKNLDLTLISIDKMYDPENPRGLWSYLDTKVPISIEYSQSFRRSKYVNFMTSDGDFFMTSGREFFLIESEEENKFDTETLNGGSYILDSMPSVDGLLLSIHAVGGLDILTGIYRRSGNYLSGRTLYDLALDVMEDAGKTYQEYFISDTLKEFKTKAYLPLVEYKNCLKLIAEAGMCILFNDRDGIIRIEPNLEYSTHFAVNTLPLEQLTVYEWMDEETWDDEKYWVDESGELLLKHDFWDMKNEPISEPSPQLKSIETSIYTYEVSQEIAELAKANIEPSAERQWITFNNAESVRFETSGNVIEVNIFGGAASFICISPGEITFFGQKIEITESISTSSFAETGETEVIRNPLITDPDHARKVTEWKVNYLKKRLTYFYSHYGDVSIEANDLFDIQTNFTENMPVRILKSETSYNGLLNGSIIAKEMR